MLNLSEFDELGKQHHQNLLAERENDRLVKHLPHQESAVSAVSRQVIRAVIVKLEALGQPRISGQPRVTSPHREA
ncbi:MAG TPA: hypothetical protein VKY59_15590 [Spirillospora sp.]|nr:hypothetical protein [Spirillospora sp.]